MPEPTKTISEIVEFTVSEFGCLPETEDELRGMLEHAVRNARSGQVVQTSFPASQEAVDFVLAQPVGEEGRSEWCWITTARGDTILGVYPTGDEGYFGSEVVREQDWDKARAEGKIGYDVADTFTGWLD